MSAPAAAAALLLAAAAGAAPAAAHDWAGGDAGWIQRRHPACCGPTDCRAYPASAARLTAGGWRIAGRTIPFDRFLPSATELFYLCVSPATGELRCAFAPLAGL